MPLPPELIAAYEKALYVVFGVPELVLRIGEPNPDLDALLQAEGAASAAFVTAANRHGERRSAWDNQMATAALHQTQTDAGYVCYAGEGRDPRGRWEAEPSMLIVGISRADAEAVGRVFEQNAVVFVEKGGAPELVVLAS